jgi:hypothetical protein
MIKAGKFGSLNSAVFIVLFKKPQHLGDALRFLKVSTANACNPKINPILAEK